MKYTIQVIKDVEIDVDFQRIHDLIHDEYIGDGWTPEELDNDWERIGEKFDNNIDYYLEKVGITDFDYSMIIIKNYKYDITCDCIVDDFYDWLEEKYDKK